MNAVAYSLVREAEKTSASVNHLVVELDHYKRRSEWLLTINNLHGRLAAALGLGSMIEAFSVWLMPLFEHDVLAYHNPGRLRTHLFCSSHGPDRRAAREITDQLLPLMVAGQKLPSRVSGFHAVGWPLGFNREKGYLLLLRRTPAISASEAMLVEAALDILAETMQRALDYEDLYDQARRDTLTGLANRRVLTERLGTFMESARRHGHPVTLASMDLDNFKEINDTLGHARGDEVLQQVARTLAAMIRQNDLLVRMGGDEFLLILPDTTLENGTVLADRLCRAVSGLEIKGIEGSSASRFGVSIGMSQYQSGFSIDEWLQRADENLYKAKAAGGDRVFTA